MKKFTKIMAAATAALLMLGFSGCTDNSGGGAGTPVSYPAFINSSTSGGGEEQTSEKYVVNVLSEGGMKLDGVQIELKSGSTVLKRGISRDGKIEFATQSVGDYELVIDENTLPAGYYLRPNTSYHTNPSKREEVNIRIPSRLLSATASVSSYAPGNIMRDFTFTDVDGGTHTLSTLFNSGKKAVVLNFFFCDCDACNAEFPYLQTAYANRAMNANDIEVLGICTTNMYDTDANVASKKTEHKLTFPVGLDRLGLCNAFGITAYPTTVVIDRYGMIAAREVGGQPTTYYWTQLFNNFASSNYVQDITVGNGDGSSNASAELVKPTEQMPASPVLAAAALDSAEGTTFTADDDVYSWPWKASDDNTYIYSSNTGVNNSYAAVHANIPLKKDEVLSFEYKISSEANADYLYIIMDGALMNTGYSGGDGKWHEVNLYVSDRTKTVDVAFVYIKDAGDPDTGTGDDVAMIRNINVSDKSTLENDAPLDVMRTCASDGKAEDANRYNHYVTYALNPDDHFFHVVEKDGSGNVKKWGPIIYMTISQLTPWSDMHTGSTSQDEQGNSYSNTIFKITENKYVERVTGKDDQIDIVVNINGVDLSDVYAQYVLIMNYMPAPFYLIPVTEDLKSWADALIADFHGKAAHENEWLEFCYYYDHYGSEHDDTEHGDGLTCKVDVDYTRGLTKYNAYNAYEQGAPELEDENLETLGTNGRNKAIINFPLQLIHNGSYYKFKASRAGVYQIRSYTSGCSPTTESTSDNASSFVTADPGLSVYDLDGKDIPVNDMVLDHDAFKGVDYEGFNVYLPLEAGEEVLLYLETSQATRSYYDFEITYKGETFEKMLVCSTGGGAWTPISSTIDTYIGIEVMYDEISGCYCAVKDGKPDPNQPVYIDMLFSSFFMCELEDYYFATLQYMIMDNAFGNHMYMGAKYQQTMNRLLGEALDKPETDPLYGLVPATDEIVDILNLFIDQNVHGGKGEGNGWLAFAVYNAIIG